MADGFDPIDEALAAVIRAAASPDVQEAQVLMLRRLALEGSVVPSRIPAPLNITELGGYLNLLSTSGDTALRTSAIAAALGLASPGAMAWEDAPPGIGFGQIGNDATGIADAAGVLLSVPMRADFAQAWRQHVLPRLAGLGATLPLWAPALRLPVADPGAAPVDPMFLLGRRVWIAPEAALADPDTDPVRLGRGDADPEDTQRVTVRASRGVIGAPWHALVWDPTADTLVERALAEVGGADVGPIVALAGFRLEPAAAPPSQRFDLSWGRLTNLTGLMPGVSRLGDELEAVWSPRAIARSAFASRVGEVWNGAGFATPD
ncbi:hypothetical protein LDO31_01295 [Luteimonas sp. XNQY3]|nr:hypothetical protein [Luteimonas sp. XNQY3]MCD9004889.1 hypothetical protein [Luteimonas sp. XNQY3]